MKARAFFLRNPGGILEAFKFRLLGFHGKMCDMILVGRSFGSLSWLSFLVRFLGPLQSYPLSYNQKEKASDKSVAKKNQRIDQHLILHQY